MGALGAGAILAVKFDHLMTSVGEREFQGTKANSATLYTAGVPTRVWLVLWRILPTEHETA